jgi:hypothetical protein
LYVGKFGDKQIKKHYTSEHKTCNGPADIKKDTLSPLSIKLRKLKICISINMAHDPLLDTTGENKESITLLWFDPNIGSHQDTEKTKEQLRQINDYVKFYTDLELCVTYIQSIKSEKIFLITSGKRASYILPRISNLRQIDSIFIFCMKPERYQHLTD